MHDHHQCRQDVGAGGAPDPAHVTAQRVLMAQAARRTTGTKSRRVQRGFTLVEMVISAGLLGFLAMTATFFWVKGFDLVQRVNNDTMAVADGRAALERL